MKTITTKEQKRIAQLRLEADWRENPFPRQYLHSRFGWMDDDEVPGSWNKYVEYRRKPTPKYVPWASEDAEQLLGVKVKRKIDNLLAIIVEFDPTDSTVHAHEWIKMPCLFEEWTKLDGTPCGKVAE